MKRDYKNPAIGCYFDGAAGQDYNDLRVLELAINYGWEDKDAQELIDKGQHEIDEAHCQLLSDVVQEAEDYLNSLETRPFLSWQWYDGDFGLYPDVEGAKEDCEFVSSRKQEYPDDDYEGEWLHVNDHGNVTLYVREAMTEEDITNRRAHGKDKEIWSCV